MLGFGLMAVVLNIYKKRACWPIWFVGNCVAVWLYLRLHVYWLIILALIYNATNVWGWIEWGRRKHGKG
jgi:nicotinamide riboside transporter PnuC